MRLASGNQPTWIGTFGPLGRLWSRRRSDRPHRRLRNWCAALPPTPAPGRFGRCPLRCRVRVTSRLVVVGDNPAWIRHIAGGACRRLPAMSRCRNGRSQRSVTFLINQEPLVGQSVVTLENHVILRSSIPRNQLHVSVRKAKSNPSCPFAQTDAAFTFAPSRSRTT